MADGHRQRRMNFERFEHLFKECISHAAIQTKFEHHYRRGMEVVRDLEELLAKEEADILEKRWMLVEGREGAFSMLPVLVFLHVPGIEGASFL